MTEAARAWFAGAEWEVLWVERHGDLRSCAILTQNFPKNWGKNKGTKETQIANALEALLSPDPRSLTLFCRRMGQLYLGGKMQVEKNDLPPKEAT
jgi:hypothetical protein